MPNENNIITYWILNNDNNNNNNNKNKDKNSLDNNKFTLNHMSFSTEAVNGYKHHVNKCHRLF
jgi:hypothetical protein